MIRYTFYPHCTTQIALGKSRFSHFYWWVTSNWTVIAKCDGLCYSNGSFFPRDERLQCVPDLRSVTSMICFRGVVNEMMESLVEPLAELRLDETERCLMTAVIVVWE